jgi:hypothetical protein
MTERQNDITGQQDKRRDCGEIRNNVQFSKHQNSTRGNVHTYITCKNQNAFVLHFRSLAKSHFHLPGAWRRPLDDRRIETISYYDQLSTPNSQPD